jgi:hypothetical protein
MKEYEGGGEYIPHMEEMRNAHKISFDKPEEKRPLQRL